MAEAKAVGTLVLDISGFTQAIAVAKAAMVGFTAYMATVKIADFFKHGTEEAIKFGNAAYVAAQRIGGADPGKLLLVQKALEAGGYSAEEATGRINEMVASGQKLSALFGGAAGYANALDSATKNYGEQAKVLSASADKFHSVFNLLESIGSKIQTFFLSMVSNFLEPLQAVLAFINQLDLSGIGEDFGKSIGNALTALIGVIKNGDLGEALGLSIQLGFEDALNWLVKAFVSLGFKIQSIFQSALETPIAYFQAAIQNLSEQIVALMGKSSIARNVLGIDENFKASSFTDNLKEAKERIQGDSATNDKNSRDAFNDSNNVFDTSGLKSDLGEIISKGMVTGVELAKHAAGMAQQPTFQHQDPFHVIASSIQKIGGGGGFITAGQSIQEKEMMKQTQLARQQLTVSHQIYGAITKQTQITPYSF